MKMTVSTAGRRLIRLFECSKCGALQQKKTISLVVRCRNTWCEFPAYDTSFNPKTHELDWYSKKKEWWILHPEAHYESIRNRTLTKPGGMVKGKDDYMIKAVNSIAV